MVLDKQVPTLRDKQKFKGQAIKNDLNAAASTAKCISFTCLKIHESFQINSFRDYSLRRSKDN
jgi:hypothetical protein